MKKFNASMVVLLTILMFCGTSLAYDFQYLPFFLQTKNARGETLASAIDKVYAGRIYVKDGRCHFFESQYRANDKEYEIDGSDLTKDIEITPPQAVLGVKKDIQTLHGKIGIKIPPKTSTGQMLRLKDLGLPKKGGGFGNLNARIKIVLPKNITQKQIELYYPIEINFLRRIHHADINS